MSKSNNLRLTINLSNFFCDHRHRARIFVNENIETIQDLQNKISQIFGIDNFYLISQDEFLPPSENVGMLQNGEVLWAMPARPTEAIQVLNETRSAIENNVSSKSRKKISLQVDSTIEKPNKSKKRKKSRHALEDTLEEEMIPEPDQDRQSKKKNKKKKSLSESESFEVIFTSESPEPKDNPRADIEKEASNRISFGRAPRSSPLFHKKNVTIPLSTDQYLEKKKINIVRIDYIRGGPPDLEQKKNEESPEEKHEQMDTEENRSEELPKPVNELAIEEVVTEAPVTACKENLEALGAKPKVTLNNSKSDICETVPETVSPNKSDLKSATILPWPRIFRTPKWRKQQAEAEKNIKFHQGNLALVPEYSDSESAKEKTVLKEDSRDSDKAPLETNHVSEKKTEDGYSARNVVLEAESGPSQSELEEVSTFSSSYVDLSSISEDKLLQTSFDGYEKRSKLPSETCNTDSSLGMSGVQRIREGGNRQSRKQISGVGALLDDLRHAASAISLESTYETDASEFVTKRVRKRSRKRQKKSHEPVNSVTSSKIGPSQPRPMNVQGSPRLHIKFGADGEAEKLEMKPRTEVDETKNESTTFLTEIGDGRKVEETDIMAYPLMTTMEPKALDVIAFKVYKLDSGYEPRISSYITARVLTFDEETKAVNLEILAGGDEFLQPEGKFFMNVEEPSKTNKYTLDWAELIEPRLLYP
ncbi:uncharacterized protein [Leptinotarsa decemlineata]|uniref:uncharacterized protein n=1 Tax=Leptinotarsa decemlineata TaxID=7539 RepID=UPI003D305D90